MGLNRMMMKNGEVTVVDGDKRWYWAEVANKTNSFTVPPGVRRIKVFAKVDYIEGGSQGHVDASIKNKMTNKTWGEGNSESNDEGVNIYHQNIDSIVGVTPNKTYTLYFNCWSTSGVTFSWGKAINAMTPTVEDY